MRALDSATPDAPPSHSLQSRYFQCTFRSSRLDSALCEHCWSKKRERDKETRRASIGQIHYYHSEEDSKRGHVHMRGTPERG